MSDFFGDEGYVLIDKNTPAVMAARKEPLHETDDDFEADLAPDELGEFVEVAGIRDVPRDALKKLVAFLIPAESHGPAKKWRVAQLRLVIMAHMLDIDGIGKQSFEDLSKELGCTRALLSIYSLRTIDGLGIEKARNGKPRRTREIYRASALKSHAARGHRIKQDAL